ncbi:MAG: MinD/ParA family protein [Phycisphaeraceae bacterium]|nr:MAG: MinD/ParA family protein [Phycisphaeraceae bacterium]
MTPPQAPTAPHKPEDDQATQLRAMVAEMESRARGLERVPARESAPRPERPAPLRPAPRSGATRTETPGARADAVRRHSAPHGAARPRARIIAVASGKGGVGKTNMCVNICVAMAMRGRRAILLDGDLGLANADVLCGVTAGANLGHVLEGTRSLDEIIIEAPGGFGLIPGAAGMAHLAHSGRERRQSLLKRLGAMERAADVIVIDCGAGIGGSVMSFVQAADLAMIVATPEPTSIADAYALIKCTHSLKVRTGSTTPGCGVLINQAVDEDEAKRAYARMAGVCERFLRMRPELIGWTPSDPRVPEAVRARVPVLVRSPRARVSQAVRVVAGSLSDRLELDRCASDARSGLLARLFGLRGRNRRS